MDKAVLDCMEQALRYLGIREHNRRELELKLNAKGYASSVTEQTLDLLSEDGSLSEERYVYAFIHSSNRRHPEGKSLILRRLAAKGADREVARTVTEQVYTDEYVEELLDRAACSIMKKHRCKAEETAPYLRKLGFSPAGICQMKKRMQQNPSKGEVAFCFSKIVQ